MTSFRLPVQYYRLFPYPVQAFKGEASKTLMLNLREIAFVSVHCWNFGTPGGPPLIPDHAECMGWTEFVPRASRIIDQRITPAMAAARRAGIPIIHVAAGHYAHRYPQWRVLMELSGQQVGYGDQDLVKEEDREPGSVEGGEWWAEYYEEVFGPGYNQVWAEITCGDSPENLDIAPGVRPLPEDYVVTHGTQLNRILRGLGIWNLVYVGFATDLCLIDVPAAMKEMAMRFNYRCVLLRDCTTTVEQPDTVQDLLRTRLALRQVEYVLGYTATSEDFVSACRAFSHEAE